MKSFQHFLAETHEIRDVPVHELDHIHATATDGPQVDHYKHMLRRGEKPHAIQLIKMGGKLHLQDGNHRLLAHRETGQTHIKAQIIDGEKMMAHHMKK